MTPIRKQILLRLCAVPLVMLLYLLLPTSLNAHLPYLHNLTSILMGLLILLWGRSVQRRILHAQTRRCLTAVSWFLFFMYLVRMSRWEYFHNSPLLNRLCWYLYYLPLLAVPLLSLHAAAGLNQRSTPLRSHGIRAAWIIGILLAAGVVTNDLHGWLLQFYLKADGGEGAQHGFLYFGVVAWSVLLSIGTLTVLIRCCRLSQCRRQLYVPVGLSAVGIALLIWYSVIGGSPKLLGRNLFYIQDIYSMIFIGLWEGCILIGLLPSNTGYGKLFAHSHISAVLKDQSGAVWASSLPVQPETAPDDLVTHTKPLKGGSITWSEDIHAIRALQAELAETNESLNEENDLIEEEYRIASERIQYETQNRLYDRIAAHTHQQLAAIAGSFTNTEAFCGDLRRNLLLGTYVKRCANLMLLADANSTLSTDELALALRETLENLSLCRIDCALQSGTAQFYPAQQLVAAYDLAEAAAEAVYDSCSVFCAEIAPDAETILLLESDAAFTLPESVPDGLRLTVTESDGTCRLQIGGEPLDV